MILNNSIVLQEDSARPRTDANIIFQNISIYLMNPFINYFYATHLKHN